MLLLAIQLEVKCRIPSGAIQRYEPVSAVMLACSPDSARQRARGKRGQWHGWTSEPWGGMCGSTRQHSRQ